MNAPLSGVSGKTSTNKEMFFLFLSILRIPVGCSPDGRDCSGHRDCFGHHSSSSNMNNHFDLVCQQPF